MLLGGLVQKKCGSLSHSILYIKENIKFLSCISQSLFSFVLLSSTLVLQGALSINTPSFHNPNKVRGEGNSSVKFRPKNASYDHAL